MPLTPEERRARNRAARARYVANNPDKVRAAVERWREKNPDYSRRRYVENRQEILAAQRRKREENLDASRAYIREWRKKNRAKDLESRRRYQAKNRDKLRAKARLKNYRRRQDNPHHSAEYMAARRERDAGRPRPDCCDVCGKHNERIVFDHCHERDVFRGWLCHDCNIILGHAHDDPDVLLKLAAYLKRTAKLVSPQLTLPGV